MIKLEGEISSVILNVTCEGFFSFFKKDLTLMIGQGVMALNPRERDLG